MKIIEKTALVLTIIGALNWGLIGLLNINLVTLLIKSSVINNIIYITIGIAAIVYISCFIHRKMTH